MKTDKKTAFENKPHSEYDLAVIGAGPAGTTLARLLGRKYRVLLVDSGRPKCCGGLLAPDAQKMIAKLGLVLPDSVLHGPQLFSVQVDDFDNQLRRYYQRHYINIDRRKFDEWLLSLVPEGVERRIPARYESAQPDPVSGGFLLRLWENGHCSTVKTKILIGADGAFSQVRRQFISPQTKRKMYTAVQYWFEPGRKSPSYGAIFDREITDYYSWTIPKGDRLIVGSAIPAGVNPQERFALLLNKLGRTFNLEQVVHREAAQILRPLSSGAICPTGNDPSVALIGEAAGWISPSSAEGISYAMQSAVALADALLPGMVGFQSRYRRNVRSLFANIFLKNLKIPAMFSPLLRKAILRSGLFSLDIRDVP